MAGLRCITLAAVPLALFALQYTQIISFVMISPPLESCTVGCYEHKNETFGPSEIRRGSERCARSNCRKKKAKNILPINLNPLICTPPYLMYISTIFLMFVCARELSNEVFFLGMANSVHVSIAEKRKPKEYLVNQP